MTITEEGLPHVSSLTDDVLLELHGNGLSAREIARRYQGGVHTTISRRLDRLKAAQPRGGPVEVPLTWIVDNPWQPRGPLVEEDIEDLAASIAKHGQLEPVRGRLVGPERVELVYGHRRVAALRRLVARGEWSGGVRCEVVPGLTDAQMMYESLAENTDRKNLSELEQARAWRHIVDQLQLSVSDLAEQLRKDRSTISNALRVLKLPQEILERVEAGEVPFRAARELLCLQNDDHAHLEDMQRVISQVLAGPSGVPDWSVKNIRRMVRRQAVRFQHLWRPLEPANGDHEYTAVEFIPEPHPFFDGDAFAEAHPGHIHNLPRMDGEKSRRWTCAVKEWQQAQQKALDRAASLVPAAPAEPEPAGAPSEPEPGPGPAAILAPAMPASETGDPWVTDVPADGEHLDLVGQDPSPEPGPEGRVIRLNLPVGAAVQLYRVVYAAYNRETDQRARGSLREVELVLAALLEDLGVDVAAEGVAV